MSWWKMIRYAHVELDFSCNNCRTCTTGPSCLQSVEALEMWSSIGQGLDRSRSFQRSIPCYCCADLQRRSQSLCKVLLGSILHNCDIACMLPADAVVTFDAGGGAHLHAFRAA